jgi:hypothetical protein
MIRYFVKSQRFQFSVKDEFLCGGKPLWDQTLMDLAGIGINYIPADNLKYLEKCWEESINE